MKLIFCNIAWLNYYKGIYPGVDDPISSGSGTSASKNKDVCEKYNFEKVMLNFSDGSFEDGEYCLGFVETKASNRKKNQLHIEKIEGCEDYKDKDMVEDVLVIYCAKHPAHGFTSIVGWYKHATVYRYYQEAEFRSGDEIYIQEYNAIAKAENCILLPRRERSNRARWYVPRKQKGVAYGFGQGNVWFAQKEEDNEYLNAYLDRIIQQIEEYEDENWLERYPAIS
ncbi:MAG TPA: hypothetical protein GXZ28_09005 [Clostridiales bacterium]|jgi:hypothetical protein|nr:hypothetical protein [Clostridiales bacterium]